ncbi:cytochrome b/b6 domain-containing protein [Actinomadura sp. HBU206391]|uniref:cytochrome b/b6 domain-containing protein n=1 Tax=Actinomadura sp. HBU206391 TaxID=2731692 RepID=UPI00164F2D3D|nr:cytochrome b/b6 domain-containing protein [Actinomadura sp. HBU206391]MBC6459018.1 cytochrome b/b6 domain-containing protein [Actinomadura sp. HBU206391]
MSRRDPGGRGGRAILRFTLPERAVHHAVALLMIICLVTAACLYVPVVAAAVGRRELFKTIHVIAGFSLPAPILAGWLSKAFRTDLGRLNRFGDVDWEWLRRSDRRVVIDGEGAIPVGKFNAGQKLNAAFVAGAILVMLGTGAMLTFPGPFPDGWRTGATFVHDWLTLGIFAAFLGHLWFAMRDRGAMAGMWDGHVDRPWAARHHPAWLAEQSTQSTPEEPEKHDARRP